MDHAGKIVAETPLYELWNAQGPIQAKRGRLLVMRVFPKHRKKVQIQTWEIVSTMPRRITS